MSEVLLEVNGLKKHFSAGSRFFGTPAICKAVDDVSFTIERGKTLGLVG